MQQGAVAGIENQFLNTAILPQQFYFINPLTLFVFQFDFQRLTRVFTLDAFEDTLERQYFARFQCLTRDFMIGFMRQHGGGR